MGRGTPDGDRSGARLNETAGSSASGGPAVVEGGAGDERWRRRWFCRDGAELRGYGRRDVVGGGWACGLCVCSWLRSRRLRRPLVGRLDCLGAGRQGTQLPLRIDPFIQQAELTPSDEGGAGEFGLHRSPVEGRDDGCDRRPCRRWRDRRRVGVHPHGFGVEPGGLKLTASDETGAGQFGATVALSADGDTALIGLFRDHTGNSVVWAFTRTGSTWSQQGPKLTDHAASLFGPSGQSVALSGDGNTALISDPGVNEQTGDASVFTRTGSTWAQQGPVDRE